MTKQKIKTVIIKRMQPKSTTELQTPYLEQTDT